eukprot:CAMPEP_0176476822 /NCGR_PEP_ID=MMETSP0200_2-20121128/269_1 /TAXON_ID=947934 /ORGANISM="Chaetoceros sp., Strain GSL56" /LENGTH=758 /DNA_ID=CAMNT_0017872541 /DNA_START=790 /DNA_END=3066 /DNA_ORIENTATION=-
MKPSGSPSGMPSSNPSLIPSASPTAMPSSKPSVEPSDFPTGMPINLPSVSPSLEPSTSPTLIPTRQPSNMPSRVPSTKPTTGPSLNPSTAPSSGPTLDPTSFPTLLPTSLPSKEPSFGPSGFPSKYPSEIPTVFPSLYPSISPSIKASSLPSASPSMNPTFIPSTTPSVVPSTTPSVVPSTTPSVVPSKKPSANPSITPSVVPSKTPSVNPSAMPSVHPSTTPSVIPSTAPTGFPTLEPSAHPSSRPSVTPTTEPSSNPTFYPSYSPSGQPSSRPSSNPSARPTQVPSVRPSSTPTQVPTQVPSVSPSKSSKPSSQPSTTPSVLPSLQPSQGPSYSKQEFEFFVTFQFDDLDDINDKSRAILVAETTRVVENALLNAHEEDSFTVVTSFFSGNRISELSTFNSTNFRRNLSWDEAILQHRRRLQTTISGFEVTLQIFVDTRSPRTYDTATLQNSIGTAFDTIDERTAFIDSLQRQDVAFNRINSVQVSIDDKDIEIETTSSNPWLYVGIGSGVAVAAISSFLFIIYRRRRRARNSSTNQVRSDGRDVRAPNEFIHVDDGEDQDVSTLGYPDAYGGNAFANPFADDDQQNESTISAAYDYKMAYGGAGGDLPSVSSAGGTKSATGTRALADDLTEGGQSRVRVDSEEISRISSAQEDLSLFEEDNSFDRMYGEDERIEVIAPPGKLGVVIDTPMNGAPMVHAIKETSVLADRVRIGDRLISVDGQDTTEMSAIRVSKLISSKAMNAQRRMVFLRPASRN